MKRKNLYLLCGPAASGKSTWAMKQANGEDKIWVSRDAVRFAMFDENDDYFAKERQVFKEWIHRIQSALDDPEVTDVFADATHVTATSRAKTLRNLQLGTNVRVIPVVFKTPREVCLQRNNRRTGRTKVPYEAMMNMFNSWTIPSVRDFPIIRVIEYKGEN